LKTFIGNSPLNAGIELNLKGTVRFNYPQADNFKKRFSQVFGTMFFLWVAILMTFSTGIIIGIFLNAPHNQETKDVAMCPCYEDLSQVYEPSYWFTIFCFLAILLFPPLWSSYTITKNFQKYARTFPKLNAAMIRILLFGKIRKAVFTELKTKRVEIPLFRNVILEYSAEGEFARYIEWIRVRPIDFKVINEYPFFKHKKEKQQDQFWKAIFTFSKIPKHGNLTLRFI